MANLPSPTEVNIYFLKYSFYQPTNYCQCYRFHSVNICAIKSIQSFSVDQQQCEIIPMRMKMSIYSDRQCLFTGCSRDMIFFLLFWSLAKGQ